MASAMLALQADVRTGYFFMRWIALGSTDVMKNRSWEISHCIYGVADHLVFILQVVREEPGTIDDEAFIAFSYKSVTLGQIGV
jgi:hypothetical protein